MEDDLRRRRKADLHLPTVSGQGLRMCGINRRTYRRIRAMRSIAGSSGVAGSGYSATPSYSSRASTRLRAGHLLIAVTSGPERTPLLRNRADGGPGCHLLVSTLVIGRGRDRPLGCSGVDGVQSRKGGGPFPLWILQASPAMSLQVLRTRRQGATRLWIQTKADRPQRTARSST